MRRIYFLLLALSCVAGFRARAVDVKVVMNVVSQTMTMTKSGSADAITPATDTGTQAHTYTFTNLEPGDYTVTGYASDGKTCNGSVDITVDAESQSFQICTVTTGVSNSKWVMGTDWTFGEYSVTTKTGTPVKVTMGQSITANRGCLLLVSSQSYSIEHVPSATRIAEGYASAVGSGTVTAAALNTTVTLYQTGLYTIKAEKGIKLFVGQKVNNTTSANSGKHYVPFIETAPVSTEEVEDGMVAYTFRLTNTNYYNFRFNCEGKRTWAGYFTYYTDVTGTNRNPEFNVKKSDLSDDPKAVEHDALLHSGANVADIFLKANAQGHIKMNVGETQDMFAQRNWQLVNTTMNNYFIEPDYHYTVLNLNGEEDDSVIGFDIKDTTWNPWVKMTAKKAGTAIVLVTYDAIKVQYMTGTGSKVTVTDFAYGADWGAIWPENTGVFVVTVEQPEAATDPIYNAKGLNNTNVKLSGDLIDAEHDVLYYLNAEEGYNLTFDVDNVKKVEIARPTIGENIASYSGFTTDGVTIADGKCNVKLLEGNSILRLTDASGNCSYQIVRAKLATLTVTNLTREGKQPQAGDKLQLQFSGLYHSANKMSGIYNMQSSIQYLGTPNGTAVKGTAGQYNFGGNVAAQAITYSIPKDWDAVANPQLSLTSGYLFTTYFGSPYGAHRAIARETGANPDFGASQRPAYLSALPDVTIDLAVAPVYGVKLNVTPTDAVIAVRNDEGTEISKSEDGYYYGIEGKYTYNIVADGYARIMKQSYVLTDESPEKQTINITMTALADSDWNGTSMTEPVMTDEVYQITTGAELAWLANEVNVNKNYKVNAELVNDINLGSFDWTPIGGTSSSTSFAGTFCGNGYSINGLYVDSSKNYCGLFGYVTGNISKLTVNGDVATTGNYAGGIAAYVGGGDENNHVVVSDCVNNANVSAKQYAGGIASVLAPYAEIQRCGNNGDITTSSTFAGGVTANLNGYYCYIYNSYNTGNIVGSSNVGGVIGTMSNQAVAENVYNIGEVKANGTVATSYIGAIRAMSGSTATPNVKRAYAPVLYGTNELSTTKIDAEDIESGKLAYTLGEPFGQVLATDEFPTISNETIYKLMVDEVETYVGNSELNIATFEGLETNAQGYWNGITDEDYTFENDKFIFNNYNGYGGTYWCKWAYSQRTETQFVDVTPDQYNSCVGSGVNGSQTFGIGYYSEFDQGIPTITSTRKFYPVGGYFTNSAYALNSMKNGDSFAKKFEEGDKFTLVATGYDNYMPTNTVRFDLGNGTDLVDEWVFVDLSSIGLVDEIRFTMESTDKTYIPGMGDMMNTPSYFCMDNFKALRTERKSSSIERVEFDANNENSDATVVKIYNVNGMEQNGFQPGVNIVKYSNGTVRKIMVK